MSRSVARVPFRQVNVFSAEPYRGNALAVVHDADDVSDAQMAAIARWTNLSETVFLLAPTTPEADYRVRIWTGSGELPFAGHPTIGSAHAWLEAGGVPASDGVVVQECGAGLVRVRRGERLAFAAPPLVRSGPVSEQDREAVLRATGLSPHDVLDMAWVDNGPGWLGVEVASARAVLDVVPDPVAFAGLTVTLVGRHERPAQGEPDVEVRAFFAAGTDLTEDPVTGSANAGLAQWLVGAGRLPTRYVAAQGQALRRAGRVYVEQVGDDLWVGGDAVTCITGRIAAG